MYAGSTGPPTPRERQLSALRHRRDVLDDAAHLERNLAWRRTRERLVVVGITVRA
jgi:hypothetical protein